MERYLACWNETDASARQDLLAQGWSTDAIYVDPLAEAIGIEAIDATVAAVQSQFPGFVFTAVGSADEHHNQARFHWGLGPAGAEPLVIGFDVVVTDEIGRITQVRGFLDKVPG